MTQYLVPKAEFTELRTVTLAQADSTSGENLIRGVPDELTETGLIVAAVAGMFTLFKKSWEKRETMQSSNYQMLLDRLVENGEKDRESVREAAKAQADSAAALTMLADRVGDLVSTQVETEKLLEKAVETQTKSDENIADLVSEIKTAIGQGKGIQDNVLTLVTSISGRLDKWENFIQLWLTSNGMPASTENGNGKTKKPGIIDLISMIR